MCSGESFIYREEYCLNDSIMGSFKFIGGQKYSFGNSEDMDIRRKLAGYYSGRNLYGVFAESNKDYDHSYFTMVNIPDEHCDIINLVCLGKGWISVK
jgi:hypothetical protein